MHLMLLFVIHLCLVVCDAISTTPMTTNRKASDYYDRMREINPYINVQQGLNSMKTAIKSIEDQMNRFNELLSSRFDQKLTSLMINVANLDGNIRSIQEKTHAWDSFQHHVSAWNEQIKSVDRKADLISSGQEKIMLLDGKLSFLLNLEYNSQRTLNKLSSLEEKIESMEKTWRNKEDSKPSPIYEEFATRGALSTLKVLEHKVDRMNALLAQLSGPKRGIVVEKRWNGKEYENNNVSRVKSLIMCSIPPAVEDLVKDMGSKIDVMHDKIVIDSAEDVDDENKDIHQNNGDTLDHDYSVEMFAIDEDNNNTSNPENIYASKRKKSLKQAIYHSIKKIDSISLKLDKQDQYITNTSNIVLENIGSLIQKMSNLDFNYKSNESIEHFDNVISYQMKSALMQINEIDSAMLKNITESNEILINSVVKDILMNKIYDLKQYLQNDLISNCKRSEFQDKSIVDATEDSHPSIVQNNLNDVKTDEMYENTTPPYYEPLTTPNYIIGKENNAITDEYDIFTSTSEEAKITTSTDLLLSIETATDENIIHGKYDIPESNKENTSEKYDYLFLENVFYTDVENLSSDIVKYDKYRSNICKNPGSERYCDEDDFIIIQKRESDSINFSQSWMYYKWGFGDLNEGNFWLGNEAIYHLSQNLNNNFHTVLRIKLEDFNGVKVWAEYNSFEVGPESTSYILRVSGFTGNASDSLTYHSGSKFSTYDVTNDNAPVCCPCSNSYGGGWWFNGCFEANLNGIYYNVPTKNDYKGIIWEKWQGENSLAKTQMSIKTVLKINIESDKIEDP